MFLNVGDSLTCAPYVSKKIAHCRKVWTVHSTLLQCTWQWSVMWATVQCIAEQRRYRNQLWGQVSRKTFQNPGPPPSLGNRQTSDNFLPAERSSLLLDATSVTSSQAGNRSPSIGLEPPRSSPVTGSSGWLQTPPAPPPPPHPTPPLCRAAAPVIMYEPSWTLWKKTYF